MTEHLIFQTPHWRISHRRDSRYAGYLMVSSRTRQPELHELPDPALAELGPVLKTAERLLRRVYRPLKVVFYKLGFSKGFSCHFHVAPVTQALLEEVARHPQYDDDPDGNDVILFLSRVYCERELTPEEASRQAITIDALRAASLDAPPQDS
ncbi:hypothetical protein [Dyella sp.]|uniref:hypothetical protein n=1 Tax=Dyella sp. TaxID=1869338 RepID=UPI002ED5047C